MTRWGPVPISKNILVNDGKFCYEHIEFELRASTKNGLKSRQNIVSRLHGDGV